VGGFERRDIEGLIGMMSQNHNGWANFLAPVVMRNPGRPELAEELEASFCAADPDVTRRFAEVTFFSDNRADLPRVTVPSLVMQCADDLVAPAGVGEYLRSNLAGSTLVRMRATGHCPHMSDPEETIQAIRDYLSRAGVTRGAPPLGTGDVPCPFLRFEDGGRVVHANAALLALGGWSEEEVLGAQLQTLLSPGARIFLQTHLFPMLHARGNAEEVFLIVRTRAGEDVDVLVQAVRRPHGDGHVVDCALMRVRERHRYEAELRRARQVAEEARAELEAQAEALQEANGRLEEQAAELQQQAAEMEEMMEALQVVSEAARGSEARFRAALDAMPGGIAIVDAHDGSLRMFNDTACAHLGYTREEFARLRVRDFEMEWDARVRPALRRLRTEPEGVQFRSRHRTRTGEIRDVLVSLRSLEEGDQVYSVWVDITEQVRAEAERESLEEQLRQAQKMEAVGRLAGGVAHDFNNLLMVIRGYASLLAHAPLTVDALASVAEIQKAADRAASLTRQLLAYGRKQALRPEVLDLGQTVARAGGMLRRLVREDVEIRYAIDPRPWSVRADPHQIGQVLMNLVINASDAIGGPGEIQVAVRNLRAAPEGSGAPAGAGPFVALAVRDTGCGMDAATLSLAFEPFFTTKGVGEGTGLGLSTVHGIVQQSGGHVWAESEPGRGSTFTVLLPAVDAGTVTDEAAAPRPGPQAGAGTILLAEDDDSVRALVSLVLREAGYQVLEARDGEDALRVAASTPVDLLLTDVVMPRMGGVPLAHRLRARRPTLPVVVMSGYAGDALDTGEELPPGATFLGKPVDPAALLRHLAEVLG
jgi:PAS domain S-box-containing protein